MTRDQASAYLEQFLEEMPASRERLAQTLERHGADPALAEDLTPASLNPMWDALSPLLAWQDGYVPPSPAEPPPPLRLEALGDLDALPSWLWSNSASIRLSPESMWLMDGMGRHLGNVLVAVTPGMRWSVGRHRIRAYVYQNHPVVTANPGHGDDDHPLHSVGIIAKKYLKGSPNARALRGLFEMWASRGYERSPDKTSAQLRSPRSGSAGADPVEERARAAMASMPSRHLPAAVTMTVSRSSARTSATPSRAATAACRLRGSVIVVVRSSLVAEPQQPALRCAVVLLGVDRLPLHQVPDSHGVCLVGLCLHRGRERHDDPREVIDVVGTSAAGHGPHASTRTSGPSALGTEPCREFCGASPRQPGRGCLIASGSSDAVVKQDIPPAGSWRPIGAPRRAWRSSARRLTLRTTGHP